MDFSHLINIVIIAVVEGLTEFLPVSSTGHMILAGELINFKGPSAKSFEIVIQLGAILAVCVVFWRRLSNVAVHLLSDRQAQLFTRNVLLGFLPSVLIGLVAYKHIKAAMENPAVVAWALLFGGIAILVIERLQHSSAVKSVESMPVKTALGIGFAQCLAMIPGVSRSGATIMGALTMGVDRKTAAEFTFFLALPTMAGATVLELYKSRNELAGGDVGGLGLLLGFSIAFVVALAVVRSFVGFIGRFGFAPFAWYRIVVGIAALVWLYFR